MSKRLLLLRKAGKYRQWLLQPLLRVGQDRGDTIKFGPLGATRMACQEAVMNQETNMDAPARSVRSWTIIFVSWFITAS